MKHSFTFIQALCLAILMIMACDTRPPARRHCFLRMNTEIKNLFNKTEDFIKPFPDKNMSVRLLTDTLKKDFMENCSTRHHLLSFYEGVLSASKISAEAKVHGIDHDFMKIQDMLQSCPSSKCESTEVTENMKELREKFEEKKNDKVIKRLNKAVNEFRNLLIWIHDFTYKKH